MNELESLPVRLRRALEGLVKADIISERELELLINTASNNAALPGKRDWIEFLWDQVTILRARAEVDRSQKDRSRKTRKRSR